MRAFAKRTPVGRCYALWLGGREAALDGRRRRALGLFRCGLDLAERLGMPFEAALCLRALGEAQAAAAILGRTGCLPWLEFGSGEEGA